MVSSYQHGIQIQAVGVDCLLAAEQIIQGESASGISAAVASAGVGVAVGGRTSAGGRPAEQEVQNISRIIGIAVLRIGASAAEDIEQGVRTVAVSYLAGRIQCRKRTDRIGIIAVHAEVLINLERTVDIARAVIREVDGQTVRIVHVVAAVVLHAGLDRACKLGCGCRSEVLAEMNQVDLVNLCRGRKFLGIGTCSRNLTEVVTLDVCGHLLGKFAEDGRNGSAEFRKVKQ